MVISRQSFLSRTLHHILAFPSRNKFKLYLVLEFNESKSFRFSILVQAHPYIFDMTKL